MTDLDPLVILEDAEFQKLFVDKPHPHVVLARLAAFILTQARAFTTLHVRESSEISYKDSKTFPTAQVQAAVIAGQGAQIKDLEASLREAKADAERAKADFNRLRNNGGHEIDKLKADITHLTLDLEEAHADVKRLNTPTWTDSDGRKLVVNVAEGMAVRVGTVYPDGNTEDIVFTAQQAHDILKEHVDNGGLRRLVIYANEIYNSMTGKNNPSWSPFIDTPGLMFQLSNILRGIHDAETTVNAFKELMAQKHQQELDAAEMRNTIEKLRAKYTLLGGRPA